MSGKSEIKPEVFRAQFGDCVRAVAKAPLAAKHNFIPRAEPDDASDTLVNVRYVIQDAGILLHGYDNLVRASARNEDSGYKTTGATGDALAAYLMLQAKETFRTHPNIHTFVLLMDKGAYMPRPKHYVQAHRSSSIVDTMEQKGVMPIEEVSANGALPRIVARGVPLPPWIAVRANRTIYRHATAELLELALDSVVPPPGRRIIFDFMDRAASSPDTLDDWMCSERLLVDAYASETIEKARELLRKRADWRERAAEIVSALGHGGHVHSVPICVETSLDGTRYTPFLLRNAANMCGEADVGVSFWWRAMCDDRVATTLRGCRRVIPAPIHDSVREYYTAADLAEIERQRAAAPIDTSPLTPAEQCAWATAYMERHQAVLQDVNAPVLEKIRAVEAYFDDPRLELAHRLLQPNGAQNPCRPGRANVGCVLSSDTDFLSLLPLSFAQLAYEAELEDRPLQWCVENSMLLSIGECKVMRTGWLSGPADYYVAPTAAAKRKREDEGKAPAEEPLHFVANELWDVAKMAFKVRRLAEARDASSDETIGARWYLERAASFATFAASCGNDYLAGLTGINRADMWQAFVACGSSLVRYDERQKLCVLVPERYTDYIKHCYWHALTNKHKNSTANKPKKPAAQMTCAEVFDCWRGKFKVIWAPPSDETLNLMYQRTQWWLVYVMRAHESAADLLDDKLCGWPPGSTDVMV